MHVHRVTRDGKATLVTRGAMDAIAISGVDEAAGLLYFIASPTNATQRYLYRAPLDGSADPVRVTPERLRGTNTYNISPNGRFAFHRFSTQDDPGMRGGGLPAGPRHGSRDRRQRRPEAGARAAARPAGRVRVWSTPATASTSTAT